MSPTQEQYPSPTSPGRRGHVASSRRIQSLLNVMPSGLGNVVVPAIQGLPSSVLSRGRVHVFASSACALLTLDHSDDSEGESEAGSGGGKLRDGYARTHTFDATFNPRAVRSAPYRQPGTTADPFFTGCIATKQRTTTESSTRNTTRI